MFISIILLSIGFSVGTAILLAFAFSSTYGDLLLPPQSRIAGYVMLASLATTQVFHAGFLLEGTPVLPTRSYVFLVYLQSAAFYWLFLGVLRPPQRRWRLREWLLPLFALLCSLFVPFWGAIPLAMLGGMGAMLHLGLLVHALRAQRRWFLLEIKVLALFAIMGICIAAASLLATAMGWRYFAAIYATLISLSFALVLHLLLRFPDITSKTVEAVATTYAVSTLSRIDCDNVVTEIKRLFEKEKIYQDENLTLHKLAGLTHLSTHQLSELINTQFQMGFSRLVRQYRVNAAKTMLIEEPRASVLSVGLSVGFTSQSNFYVAFKELTGVVPGQFRKQIPPDATQEKT